MNVILLFCCTFDPLFIKARSDHCIVFLRTSLTRDGLIPILQFLTLFKKWLFFLTMFEKSRNGDTLGPVELIVLLEQVYQGDWREQDDQGEVHIHHHIWNE